MQLSRRFLTVIFALTAIYIGGCGNDNDNPPAQAASEAPRETANTTTAQPLPDTQRFAGLPPPYNAADYSLGRRTFKLCGSCHTVNKDGQNLVGPNLFGIIGREAGTVASYDYSPTLEEAALTWTPELLDEWLANPNSFLPGNNMTFAGVRRPADRQAVIAYLMLESGYDAPDARDAETTETENLPD